MMLDYTLQLTERKKVTILGWLHICEAVYNQFLQSLSQIKHDARLCKNDKIDTMDFAGVRFSGQAIYPNLKLTKRKTFTSLGWLHTLEGAITNFCKR